MFTRAGTRARTGAAREREWNASVRRLRENRSPGTRARVPAAHGGRVARGLEAHCDALLSKIDAKAETIATRKASQNAIEGLAPALPELVGGSADLAGSNLTLWSGSKAVGRGGGGNYISLRRARVRHGRDHERHGAARRADSLWRHLPHVLRLRAQRAAHGGADEGAQHFRVHARFHRAGRGRTHAPVGRARGQPAPDAQPGRLAPLRYGGIGGGVDRCDRAPRRA